MDYCWFGLIGILSEQVTAKGMVNHICVYEQPVVGSVRGKTGNVE